MKEGWPETRRETVTHVTQKNTAAAVAVECAASTDGRAFCYLGNIVANSFSRRYISTYGTKSSTFSTYGANATTVSLF